jgi:hypothetical protein
MDELYVKDDKGLQSDCLANANEWFKQRDDENFQKELLLIQEELKFLDEGKSHISTTLSFSSTCLHRLTPRKDVSKSKKKNGKQALHSDWIDCNI